MRLRKDDAGLAFPGLRAGDHVLRPALHAAVVRVLEPREAVAVRCETGDHISLAVAIHIEGVHLRAAAKLRPMESPRRRAIPFRRLFPPAPRFENVHAPVAIHIAIADAVRELLVRPLRRDRAKLPRLARLAPVRLRIAEETAVHAEQLGLSVARDVHKHRRFIVRRSEDRAPLPRLVLALWVLEPERLRAGEADDHVVHPSVATDVVRVVDEVV